MAARCNRCSHFPHTKWCDMLWPFCIFCQTVWSVWIRSVGTGRARSSTWARRCRFYLSKQHQPICFFWGSLANYLCNKSLVLEPLNMWKGLSSNICIVRTSCHRLDTGLYETNSFIISRAPHGQRLEKPRNKAVLCLVYLFDNWSQAKKGDYVIWKQNKQRCRSMYSHTNGNRWPATGKHTGSQINTNIHLKRPKESIETDGKQKGCRGSSFG